MTEKEKLINFLEKGYQPHMMVREISKEEAQKKLPEPYLEKKVFALPLVHKRKENLMYYFTEEETLKYAKELVEDAKAVIGYHLCVYCGVTSSESIQGREVHFGSVIKSLRRIKGWEVKESEYANVFELHFEIEGDNRELLMKYVDEVRKIALILSIKNKMGFTVSDYSRGTKHKAQPFVRSVGSQEGNLKGIQEQDLQNLSKLYNDEKCLEAASALRLIYSQINDTSKIVVAWATIEEIFETKPQHLLNKGELKAIVKGLDELEIDGAKLTTIKGQIKKPEIISEQSRNERIAQGIADSLDKNYKTILSQIKALSGTRGKHVHTLKQTNGVKEHLDFVEEILYDYIKLHCRVNLS